MSKPIYLHIRAEPPIAPNARPAEVKKAYFRERQKVQTLADELARAEYEKEVLHKQLMQKELELHRQSIEHEMELKNTNPVSSKSFDRLKKRLKRILFDLMKEVESLKKTEPVKNLLLAKEAEIRRAKRFMEALPRGSAERRMAEEMLRAHIAERDELHQLVQSSDFKFDEQSGKITELLEEELSIESLEELR